MNYNRFKECLCINKHNICQVGPYKIEVVLDDVHQDTHWNQLEYITKKEYKIQMCNPNRSVKELLFDFYREVGRINQHHGLLDLHKADKYYDRNNLIAPKERSILVVDMSLDEYAAIQMDYNLTSLQVLPYITKNQMKTRFMYESDIEIDKMIEKKNQEISIRRGYLDWVIKNKDKTSKAPKKLKNIDPDILEPSQYKGSYDKYPSEGAFTPKESKPVEKKAIRVLAAKMSLSDWTDNFDDMVKHIIKVYNTPFENLKRSDFILETKTYFPLDDKPDDWGVPNKYYKSVGAGYILMKKIPEFVPGLYFSLVEKDPKDLMKELYEEYHEIVSTFLVKYYDNYSKSFSTNDRGMYKYIIENTLKFYIENDAFPTADSINELKIQWFKRNTSDYAKISDTAKSKEMLTYKERRKLLEQAFAVVAERHNITNYTIIDSYELNDNMNAIVEKFRNNDKHLDDAVLPYIRSSV